MPPKTKRQIAGSYNYGRWKDSYKKARVRDEVFAGPGVGARDTMVTNESRIATESTSEEAEIPYELAGDDTRFQGGSINVRISEVASGDVHEQSTSKEQESTKHPKLADVHTLAAEPLQEWLDNLPRDDLQYWSPKEIWSTEV